jgi:hypothetical protein
MENPSSDSETIGVKRDEKGHLLPGSVLNPKGMKRGTKHMTTLLRAAIQKVYAGSEEPADVLLVRKTIAMALSGDQQAIKLIYNYLDGMPSQEIKTVDEFDEISTEEMDRVSALLGEMGDTLPDALPTEKGTDPVVS